MDPAAGISVGDEASRAEAEAFTRDYVHDERVESVSCRGPFPLRDGDTAACTARYHQADGAACSQTLDVDFAGGRLSSTAGSGECAVPPR